MLQLPENDEAGVQRNRNARIYSFLAFPLLLFISTSTTEHGPSALRFRSPSILDAHIIRNYPALCSISAVLSSLLPTLWPVAAPITEGQPSLRIGSLPGLVVL